MSPLKSSSARTHSCSTEANRGAKTKTLEVIRELLPHGDGRGHGRAVVRPFRLVH